MKESSINNIIRVKYKYYSNNFKYYSKRIKKKINKNSLI